MATTVAPAFIATRPGRGANSPTASRAKDVATSGEVPWQLVVGGWLAIGGAVMIALATAGTFIEDDGTKTALLVCGCVALGIAVLGAVVAWYYSSRQRGADAGAAPEQERAEAAVETNAPMSGRLPLLAIDPQSVEGV
jgi:hypothetical protein